MPTLADQIAPKPQQPSGLGGWLASIGDEMAGAFARYGRRSGAQRDASLALMSQAADPNTDPLTGAGMKALGLAGLVTHPLAFFPTREEWDQRLQAAGNDSRIGRSIGGFLSDLPSLIDPQMAAGGAATVAPAIFAGMMAKTADLKKFQAADKLEALGHTASDIRDMTGLHKGPDGKWRNEISDANASLRFPAGDPRATNINTMVDHPEFLKAYPRLGYTEVSYTGPQPGGRYIPKESSETGRARIEYGGATPEDQKSVILHELQHAVASVEGFDPGAAYSKGGDAAEWDRYFRNAGETEARNVQTRMNMSAQDLADETNAPWLTQDVPYSQQILSGGGGVSQSAPSTVSRDKALQGLVDQPQRRQLTTQSYKETLPDGTERWVPGTLRSNPTTAPRFEPSMSIADIRRYIEQFGEPPPPRAKGEIVTGKRKDVYQDGTVTPVPGLLRTKRPASLGEALQATAPLAAKMLNKADDVADAGITAYHASPYKFDKFSMQHMGTGHGKQQEGAGLYFTDDSLLADEYWKNHAGKSPEAIAEKFATNWGPEAASKLEQFAARRSQEMRPEAVKPLYDALEMLRSGADTSSKGARYMVRISAAGDEILDLTKGGKVPVEIGDPLKLTPETAKKNGIKVLAYKAGVESSNPSAKNYVVFDESIITILKKYGIPMTAGAGGAMMVAGQDMPPELASQMGGT